MLRDEIDWLSGQVELWGLDDVDVARPLAAQQNNLKEDLAQVAYPNGVVLDIGWYRNPHEEGTCRCFVRAPERSISLPPYIAPSA